ncbi:MAG: substrate-binding domain-containing protein [Phycisphaeraceae bacterium]
MSPLQHTPQLLQSYLKTLRLPAMLRECDSVARQAAEHSATYELFLQQLSELEVQQRQAASIGRRLKQAGFPVVKELSEFDFAAAPRLNKKRLLDLAQCRFIDQRSNLVLNGAPGTGKTHLAIALGRRVGDACRQRVLTLAREMGYEPRLAAQLLRAKRTGQIGLVMAATDSVQAFAGEMSRLVLGHFVRYCTANRLGYSIEFHHHEQDEPPEAPESGQFTPPQQVTARMVDGLLLVGDVGEPLRQFLAGRTGFPWVSIEEPAPLCVLSASDVTMGEAVRLLAGLGHRRLAYAGGPQRYTQQRLGLEGFNATTKAMGLQTQVQLFPGRLNAATEAHTATAAVAWAQTLIQADDRPTAFVCHGEVLARAVIHAITERGLRVPRDVSVVSYGSAFEAARRYPRLATIENDYATIADQAMEMLRLRIAGQPVHEPTRRIKPRLIPGDTVAPAPERNQAADR